MSSQPGFCAMVLSAGYGTRLAPLTEEMPKPLVPIANEPLLGSILRRLHRQGAARLVVNAHHHAEQVETYVKSLGFPVEVSREGEILGTAGGLARARGHFFEEGTIVVNGDIWGELPVTKLLESKTPGLVLAVVERPWSLSQAQQGTVGMDADGRVVRLRGEVFGREVRSGDYMGVAFAGANCLDALPERGCLIGDFALPHLRAKGEITTVTFDGTFTDVGTPSTYLQANLSAASATPPVSVPTPPGIVLERCVVGDGVTLLGEGLIEDCVLLAGATVCAPLRRAIVTPRGRVIVVDVE